MLRVGGSGLGSSDDITKVLHFSKHRIDLFEDPLGLSRRNEAAMAPVEQADAERGLGVFHQAADAGADTLRSFPAPAMVPVTITARMTSIWRSVSIPAATRSGWSRRDRILSPKLGAGQQRPMRRRIGHIRRPGKGDVAPSLPGPTPPTPNREGDPARCNGPLPGALQPCSAGRRGCCCARRRP